MINLPEIMVPEGALAASRYYTFRARSDSSAIAATIA
jgi:hypothetical protein